VVVKSFNAAIANFAMRYSWRSQYHACSAKFYFMPISSNIIKLAGRCKKYVAQLHRRINLRWQQPRIRECANYTEKYSS
jgi:hypothetical protein